MSEYDSPYDCKCGHGFWEHDITTKKKPCSRLSCGCAEYRAKVK